MTSVASLLPESDAPSRKFRRMILEIAEKIAPYQPLITSDEDFAFACAELRREGLDRMIFEAAAQDASEKIGLAKSQNMHNANRGLARIYAMQTRWQNELESAGLTMTVAALVSVLDLGRTFGYMRVPELFHNDWTNQQRYLGTAWGAVCARIHRYGRRIGAGDAAASMIVHKDHATYLRTLKHTWCVPGKNADEYQRLRNGVESFQFGPDRVPNLESLLGVRDVFFTMPPEGADLGQALFVITTQAGAVVTCRYSLQSHELYTLSEFSTLRDNFKVWGLENAYEILLSGVRWLIIKAVLTEAIDIVPRSVGSEVLPEALEDDEEHLVTTDEVEIASPAQGDEVPQIVAPRKPQAYLRELHVRDALVAFERLGTIVTRSHHNMVSLDGRTARFSSAHDKDGHKVRRHAKAACKTLGIAWEDFIAALP